MNVFNFDSYQDFLKNALPTVGPDRGKRVKLAQRLNCQTGFVSRAIKGDSQFSIEHGIQIAKFLNLTEDESDYFLLLMQKYRAGTSDLRDYFARKIIQIQKKREKIKNRVKTNKELSSEQYVEYYGHWYYAAIHILCSIPLYSTKEKIAEKLQLPLQLVSTVLEFLGKNGLVEEDHGIYTTGNIRLHLDKNSKMISKHHMNWRMESIKALEIPKERNLHYSGAIAISKKDADRVRQILLESISSIEKVITPSLEEELFVVGIDFIEK